MISVIEKKSAMNTSEGMAYGPFGIVLAASEIHLNDDGKAVYITASWVGECDDVICVKATTESIYEFMLGLKDEPEDSDRYTAIRDDSKVDINLYSDYGTEAVEMVKETLKTEYIDEDEWDEFVSELKIE